MTVEEIKQSIAMPDQMAKYGISIKRGMCSCPFHGSDKHPSMKVFKDGANCFTCGWNGDIFKFVQDIEHCDFKTAYLQLGGEYKKHKNAESKALTRRNFDADRKRQEYVRKKQKELRNELSFCIKILLAVIRLYEPFEDEWCSAQNDFPYVWFLWEEITNNKELDYEFTHGKCERIKQRYTSV